MADMLVPSQPVPSSPQDTSDAERKVPWYFQLLYFFANLSGHLTIIPTVIFLLPMQIKLMDPHNAEFSLGWVEAVGGIASVIAAPIMGAISDRTTISLGRRRFWMLLSAVCAALSLFLLSRSSTLWLLSVGWFLLQFFADTVTAMLQAVIPDRIPQKQRGLLSVYVGLAIPLAVMVGSIIIAVFLKNNKLTAYYVFMGAILLLTLFFSLVYKERPISRAEVPPFRWVDFLKNFWISPRKHPDFAWTFLTRLLFMLGYFAITAFLKLYMENALHYEALFPGKTVDQGILTVETLMTVTMVIGSFVGGIVSDKIQRRKPVVAISALIVMVACLFPALSTSWNALLAWAIILGLGYGSFFAVDTALATQVLPKASDRGKDIGIIAMAMALPQIFSPMIGSSVLWLSQKNYSFLFLTSAVLVLLSALLVRNIKSVR
uniref:MFS transporter n=1 Tax=Thermosporothrix sp. COM3 TaxID=2490863 RepID=A0A455SDT6_9CHLR|nr:MFS transporter [Thermosporothrix sp. COM3]